MKIKSLWISEYKNLKDLTIPFHSSLSLLVGQNGLGKSNLIEILALIFSELYLAEREEDILSFLRQKDGFGYIIDYELNNQDIKIELNDTTNSFSISLGESELSFASFKKDKTNYLPSRVIGYYSGENKRIFNILEKHIGYVKGIQRKRKNLDSKLRSLFFVENYHSQLILLTLAIYKIQLCHVSADKECVTIDKLFSDYLKISNIDSFTIRFNNPEMSDKALERLGVTTLGEGFTSYERDDTFWGLKSYPHKLMNFLLELFPNEFIAYPNTDEDNRTYVKEILEFPTIEIDSIREELLTIFPDPLDFFDALESCSILGVLGKLSIEVQKEGFEKTISFEQLSEGEQQLASVMGILLLTSDEQNIFLLDEPDTHLNPHWQRQYVKLVENLLTGKQQSHVIISTHSPLLVQAYTENDLILFRKENKEIKIDTENHQINNWRIDHVLTSPYFELPSARSVEYDPFMKAREQFITNSSESNQIKNHGDDLGYLPTGETYLEVETQKMLFEIAKQIKKDEKDR